MADILINELTAVLARDAQNLRPASTISGDAKESQDFFEREMMLTCRDDDIWFIQDDVEAMNSEAADSLAAGTANARRTYDRFDVSGAGLSC